MISCLVCQKHFQPQEYEIHLRVYHGDFNDEGICYVCSKKLGSQEKLDRHKDSISHRHNVLKLEQVQQQQGHGSTASDIATPNHNRVFKAYEHDSMFGNYSTVIRFIPEFKACTDIVHFLQNSKTYLVHTVNQRLGEEASLKFMVSVNADMVQATDETKQTSPYFNSKQRIVYSAGHFMEKQLEEAFEGLRNAVEKYTREGSGWVVKQIPHIDLHLVRYNPMQGDGYIPLPSKLANKKAIINVQNDDNKCFMWSVLAALFPSKKHAQRVEKYVEHQKKLNFEGIQFPVKFVDIPAFEYLNNISIDVYIHDKKSGLALAYKTMEMRSSHINLLLLINDDQQHYCWIKDLDRLLFSQNKDKAKKHICPKCIINQHTEERLALHMSKCHGDSIEPEVIMPSEREIKFKNWQRCLKAPYIIYSDFECVLAPEEKADSGDLNLSYTIKLQKHVPCSYGLIEVKSCCEKTPKKHSSPEIYRGENASEKFLESVVQHALEYQKSRNMDKKEVSLTVAEQKMYTETVNCSICCKKIKNQCNACEEVSGCDACKDGCKVREHCHLCGKYRGAAHSLCNLKYRLNRDVTVVTHGLRNYDSHIIMQALGKVAKMHRGFIDCIPKGGEDYLMFFARIPYAYNKDNKPLFFNLKFIDSFAFMSSSLEELASNLTQNDFNILAKAFPDHADQNILRQKCVYPYEYLDSMVKFSETQLPPKDQFFSSLRQETVSDGDYDRAQQVWNHFRMQTLGDYHDLYLKTDVLLLADVFEKFRATMHEHYGLDPAYYVSLPSYAWDCCLKLTSVQLDTLQDRSMYEFCEAEKRGGIAMIAKRFARANNKYMVDYDPEKPSSHIMYLDANNLYGWGMNQALPKGDFRWVEDVGEVSDYINPVGNKGYLLEVDLEYPEELHDLHNDYPLAAEKLMVKDCMLSPYSLRCKEKLSIKSGVVEKLVPNFYNKEKYILHYRNLKLYMELGLKVTKIHRVLSFNQETWMSPYIEFNTRMRAIAINEFEKNLFKLMNNAVFGKTMEDVRKYVDVRLVTSEQEAWKHVRKPNFLSMKRLGEDLAAIQMERSVIELNKAIYVGVTILELSKCLMYDFHYNYIKHKYGSKATLLFTDTDSLCYEIETEDICQDMRENLDLFDTSNYPKNHELYSTDNKKKIGKFKDESAGKPIVEVVELRTKMYSIKYENEEEKRVAKGVSKTVTTKILRHQNYVNVLFNGLQLRNKMYYIRNKKHELFTIEETKISLSCFDDKRYIVSDGDSEGIATLSYGHKNCK